MSVEIPSSNPEIERKPDNARKFILPGGAVEVYDLAVSKPTEYDMTVDYTAIEEGVGGDYKEEKIAHKKFDDGSVKILKIRKEKLGGNRNAEKVAVAEESYAELTATALKHLSKRRYELIYQQADGKEFDVKYDVIENGALFMIEVEGYSGSTSGDFDVASFPVELIEVSGNQDYEGYHIVDTLAERYR